MSYPQVVSVDNLWR